MAETDDAILKELREQFTYGTEQWQDARDEGDIDMRCLCGDVWDPEEREEREEAGRPCLSLDELTQYVNQLINDIRSSKRGIQVTPKGNGANDKTAEFRQGLMRQIEYESNAQQSAYIVMAENAFQRGYGFMRIKPEYVDDQSFDQRLRFEPIPDPNTVTIDPDIVRTDGKDMQWGFIRESRTTKQFAREFPYAKHLTFTDELRKIAGREWISGDRVNISEYWRVEPDRRESLLLKPPPPSATDPQPKPLQVFADELETMPSDDQILKRRWVNVPRVRQYFTNGLELLRPKDQEHAYVEWPGRTIPIVTCFGKVMYVQEGGETKRKFLSLIRLARQPAMLYSYYATCEAELVGMTPKTPFIGYKGQFRGVESEWEKVNHEPLAYLEANPTSEGTGANILPLPIRAPYDPPIQQLEIGKEAARRAIQSAMGISPEPTAAQRDNEKSGIALSRINSQEQKGSFHFVDHYDESLTRGAEVVDELIEYYYDSARDVTVRNKKDDSQIVRVNDPTAKEHIPTDVGDHDVTLSTGPSFDSERDAASDFADSLVTNEQAFGLIGDLVVKLKNLGPIGDEIADRLTPPQFRKTPGADGEQLPPQVQAMLGQAKQETQKLQQDLAQALDEIKTERVKAQTAVNIKQMELDSKERTADKDRAARIEIARITAAKQTADQIREQLEEAIALGVKQHHESAEATKQRAHEVGQAVLEHHQDLEKSTQTHQQKLEQGAQATEGQMATQQQAADLAPDPTQGAANDGA